MSAVRLLALALSVSILVACGTARAATAVPARSPVTDHLTLVVGGIPVDSPLTAIPLTGDIGASVRIEPSADARYARSLRLTLERPSGLVLDARVLVDGSMPFMSHGAFRVVAEPSAGGSYTAELPLEMPGPWRLVIEVTSGADSGKIDLDLETFG